MKLLRVKYYSIEFLKNDDAENCYLSAILEIENNGEVNDVNYKILLDGVSFSDFMVADDVQTIKNEINSSDNFTVAMNSLRKFISTKAAGDLALEIVDSTYIPSATLKEQLEATNQAIAELSMLIAPTT